MKNKLKKIIAILLLSILCHTHKLCCISAYNIGKNIKEYIRNSTRLSKSMLIFGSLAALAVLIKNNFNDDDIDFFSSDNSELKGLNNLDLNTIEQKEKKIREELEKTITVNQFLTKKQEDLKKKKEENNKKLEKIEKEQNYISKEKKIALEKFSHEQQKQKELEIKKIKETTEKKIADLNKELALLQSNITPKTQNNTETKEIIEKNESALELNKFFNINKTTPFSYQQIISQNK